MPESCRFAVGKLPPQYLERLLSQSTSSDPRLVLGPRVGEDAAVIEIPEGFLVVKTDPISFATEKIGWYSVHINANDIAVLGAAPRWFLATLLLPEAQTTPLLVEEIFADILSACGELGVTLCGGHTEITHGLNRPIVVGQMLGEVPRQKLLRKESLEPGDLILLAQGVAVEGTAVIAREKSQELSGKILEQTVERARRFLSEPGISVVAAAQTVAATGTVKAMHDPTEGGVLGGLYELAVAARLGILVLADEILVLPETREICSVLELDPLALLASGSLLIGAPAGKANEVIGVLGDLKIPAAVVAEMLPPNEGCWLRRGGEATPLKFPARDELAKLFERTAPQQTA